MNKPTLDACRCCDSAQTQFLWHGKLLHHNVAYFECGDCGYVQTEQPYWLEEAYSESINPSDTGIMGRNLANVQATLVTLKMLGLIEGCVLDYAGGYGFFVRLLRDKGVDALWHDSYSENLVARGFEYTNQNVDLITTFEVFEHFVQPTEELDGLLKICKNILLTTTLISDEIPGHEDWWYYGKEHGQHIGFYRIATLKKMAVARGLKFYTNGVDKHLISEHALNQSLWRFCLRASRFLTPLITKPLTSKTWADHLELSDQSKPSKK